MIYDLSRRHAIAGLGSSLLLSTSAWGKPATVVADTANGRVRGRRIDGTARFLGIAYGAAPVSRRFMPPLEPTKWGGVRDCFDYGPMAPQPIGRGDPPFLSSWQNPQLEAEDCLRLNLWTPNPDVAKRPVMVWLHGGGFTTGSGSSLGFDGRNIAHRGDIVLVSVTHRLNAFGHLYLAELGDPDLADSGNVGMLDVVAALRWVRENIASFGGDPANVTIFGQSGGAGKVTTLMAMPSAQGLFHRAIVQSGSTGIGARSSSTASEDAIALLRGMGLRPDEVGRLRTAPANAIVQGMKAMSEEIVEGQRPWRGFSNREWRPVLDGRSLPIAPFYPDAPAVSANVPMLIGTTHDECRYHLGTASPSSFSIGWDDLEPSLLACMRRDPSSDIAFFRERYPEASASDTLFRAFTYWRWRHSAIWQAEARLRAGGAPVYMYRMDWRTPIDDGKWHALHMIDVPFAFDNLRLSKSFVSKPEAAQRLAGQVCDAWTSFARTGTPGHSGLPGWAPYDSAQRTTMLFDTRCRAVQDPESDERTFYRGAPPRLSL